MCAVEKDIHLTESALKNPAFQAALSFSNYRNT